jgi:hypothetical protein
VFADAGAATTIVPAGYLRFRISPNPAIALAALVKQPAKAFTGEQRELYLLDRLAPRSRHMSDCSVTPAPATAHSSRE